MPVPRASLFRRALRHARALATVAFVGVTLGARADAQGGVIRGVVKDTLGVPVAGTELAVDGTGARVASDEQGSFRLSALSTGLVTLSARRLGYAAKRTELRVAAGDSAYVELRLVPLPATLPAVVVRADRMRHVGRLAGYYERLQRRAAGSFITREQIERENPRLLTQLLQRVPGIQLTRSRGGGPGGVRMRGRSCAPLVWMDGMASPAGEVDLDSFAPSSLEGIELYLGSTDAPSRYQWMRGESNCGTILLWSREPFRAPPTADAEAEDALATAIRDGAVFTADRVDVPVRPDSAARLTAAYPASLYASGVGGRVVAEFVVDTVGRVDAATVRIVSSTHPLFSASVQTAVEAARFTPAFRRGRPVPQAVQQPFEFAPKRASAHRR